MGIKNIIKSNKMVSLLGKKYYIFKQFFQDARDFSRYFLFSAEKKKDYRYSILLIVHSLEKGMCFAKPRPFGIDKVRELMLMLSSYPDSRKNEFEYQMGISILYAWIDFFKKYSWDNELTYHYVVAYLKDKPLPSNICAGKRIYRPLMDENSSAYYEEFFLSRHSVRDFQDKKILCKDVDFAVRCFAETPTACNRQMCRIYYVENSDIVDLLNRVLIGIPGFNKSTVQYFVITYELTAFAYSGERQQGLFNAGLCTMSFINGLHAKGIGSCCLQWSNKYKEDYEVRKRIGISDSERIGIVIGAGYYLDKCVIPCSVRRKPEDIFKVI